eukprot:TRINITY_DN14679_c0_g1_i1.p1 TRINITY_DN14679_c0_g1~~TRINITY_DN14679_c0_g1_i1.p1  ORF type:complete len:283 (+),score=68.09 TRINITY_DN14679_c0_g1_i1:100-948(+)
MGNTSFIECGGPDGCKPTGCSLQDPHCLRADGSCVRSSVHRFEYPVVPPMQYEHPHSAELTSRDPSAGNVPALSSTAPVTNEDVVPYFAEADSVNGSQNGAALCDAGRPHSGDTKQAAMTNGSSPPSPQQVTSAAEQAQQVVKEFVRSIVRGMTLQLASSASQAEYAVVSLDRKLRTMYMHPPDEKDQKKKRTIRLEQVIEIAIGAEVCAEVDTQLDDFCVTLLLDNYEAISFRFTEVEERDTFALCLSMFVDGRREEVQRKKAAQAAGPTSSGAGDPASTQ